MKNIFLVLLFLFAVVSFSQHVFELRHRKVHRLNLHHHLRKKYYRGLEPATPTTAVLPLQGDINTFGEFFLNVTLGTAKPFDNPQTFELQGSKQKELFQVFEFP